VKEEHSQSATNQYPNGHRYETSIERSHELDNQHIPQLRRNQSYESISQNSPANINTSSSRNILGESTRSTHPLQHIENSHKPYSFPAAVPHRESQLHNPLKYPLSNGHVSINTSSDNHTPGRVPVIEKSSITSAIPTYAEERSSRALLSTPATKVPVPEHSMSSINRDYEKVRRANGLIPNSEVNPNSLHKGRSSSVAEPLERRPLQEPNTPAPSMRQPMQRNAISNSSRLQQSSIPMPGPDVYPEIEQARRAPPEEAYGAMGPPSYAGPPMNLGSSGRQTYVVS